MPALDYYQILGIPPSASPEALKRAYRDLVRRYHPDLNADDELSREHFRAIQDAYDVLSDPERRRAYDATVSGAYLLEFGFRTTDSAADHVWLGEEQVSPSEVVTDVTLTFEQALKGGQTYVANGDGELVRVTIPRGCRDGTAVRLAGRGHSDDDGAPLADLYVRFRVQPHPRFRREGNHLHVIEKLSVMEALLGTTRTVRDPHGRNIRIRIRAGVQPGDRLRLRGQGVQSARGTGDLFVEIDVEVPRELTDEQRAELRETAQKLGLL
jgi:DnaJ-class molecular chaperone